MTAAQISDPWPGSCWEAKYGKGKKKKKSCSYSSPLEQLDLPTLLPSHDYFSLITATEEGVLMRDKSRNSRMLHNCFYWGVKIYRKEHGKCLKTESSDSGFITEVAMWPKKNHIISLASLFFRVNKMDFCTVGWQWESREEIHIEAFPKKPDCSGHWGITVSILNSQCMRTPRTENLAVIITALKWPQSSPSFLSHYVVGDPKRYRNKARMEWHCPSEG